MSNCVWTFDLKDDTLELFTNKEQFKIKPVIIGDAEKVFVLLIVCRLAKSHNVVLLMLVDAILFAGKLKLLINVVVLLIGL